MARSCRSVTAASAKRTIRPWTGRRSAPAPEVADNRGMSVTTPSDVEALRAEIETLRGDRDRANCMATIQSDAVQLALDLLVTHPDLRGFFRMFVTRLVDEVEAHACGVWLVDEASGACDLWMANIGGETLMADSPEW